MGWCKCVFFNISKNCWFQKMPFLYKQGLNFLYLETPELRTLSTAFCLQSDILGEKYFWPFVRSRKKKRDRSCDILDQFHHLRHRWGPVLPVYIPVESLLRPCREMVCFGGRAARRETLTSSGETISRYLEILHLIGTGDTTLCWSFLLANTSLLLFCDHTWCFGPTLV